ncbi:prolyl aminopeptidase [Tistrella bauzanensis]|uniref:Proline iminopeptidase n=1 Tax=Tistrella arctica TaxID=3133430 RepID=A0ABU9YFP9_9PROT
MMDAGSRDLHPPIEADAGGQLDLGDGHVMAWEACGRPDGVPVVFLHGGPGTGVEPAHRRFFDPRIWRAVLFDQRGCGRSTPHGETQANTTDHLVADIERLRRHLGIERWAVFGGSWGSTLALAYATTHPDRVTALMLRGIFLGTDAEVAWFLHDMGRFFPEAHAAFLAHLPVSARADPLAGYLPLLMDPDPRVHAPAARAWSGYETACATLRPPPPAAFTGASPATLDRGALAVARLEAHYFAHRCFLAARPLLDRIAGDERVRGLPVHIAQGRYDVICPPDAAHRLAATLGERAVLEIIPDAGHSAFEPGTRRALVQAADRFGRQLARGGRA